MLRRDESDLFTLIRRMRQDQAQDRTDIQRLMNRNRQVIFDMHTIGGYEQSSISDGSAVSTSGPTPAPGDNTTDAGGGPGPDPVDDDCCLWVWNGAGWDLLIDNTGDDCDCAAPDFDGAEIGEFAETCCTSASSSSSCVVNWWFCDLPCSINVEIDFTGATQNEANDCWRYEGSYTLEWNESAGRYEDNTCRTFQQDLGGGIIIYWAWKIYATPQDSPNEIISVSIESWTGLSPVTCTGTGTVNTGADCEVSSCEPLAAFANVMAGCGDNEVTITEA